MSFLTRVLVAVVLMFAYLTGGVQSLVALSAQATPQGGGQAGGGKGIHTSSHGSGGTGGGCGIFLPKK
jgi:hypothetical protein